MILYYGHINPDELTDEDWARHYNNLVWIRQQEQEAQKAGMKR